MASHKREPWSTWVCFVFAALIAGYGALFLGSAIAQSHGELREHQLTSTLLIGLLGLIAWAWMLRTNRISQSGSPLEPLALLIPAYGLFQLLPFPLSVARVISPARARLVDAVSPFVATGSSTPLSVTPSATLYVSMLLASCAVLFLVIWSIGLRLSRRPWILMLPLLILAVGESLLGLVQVAQGANRYGVALGTFGNRNHLSGFLELVLPFAAMQPLALLRRPDARGRTGHLNLTQILLVCVGFATAAVILVGVISTLSRAGFVSAMASLMFVGLAAFSRGRSWRQTLVAAGAMGVIALLATVLLPSQALLGRLQESNEFQSRTDAWRDTTRLIAAYPVFGCGLGGYEAAFSPFKTSNPTKIQDYAHNDYLQYLAEMGVVGFILAAIPMLLIFDRMRRCWTRPPNPDWIWLNIACAGSLVAIGLHSAADFNLYIPANMLAFAWVLGVAAACGGGSRRRSSAIATSSPESGIRRPATEFP